VQRCSRCCVCEAFEVYAAFRDKAFQNLPRIYASPKPFVVWDSLPAVYCCVFAVNIQEEPIAVVGYKDLGAFSSKPPKMIRRFTTKRFRILPTPWSKFETSETSCLKFYPRTQASYEVALEIAKQKKNSHDWRNACETCLLKTIKLLLGEVSDANANIRRNLFAAILFRETFQICWKMWKTRW